MSNDYDIEYYKDNGQIGDRIALKFFSALVKKRVKSGKILDFGCGTGYFLAKFNSEDFEKYGHDISSDAIKVAKANNPHTRFVKPETIEDNSMDCICSLHTLEHIENPKPIIEMFQRKLKQGGILFFVVPNDSSIGKSLKGDNWFAYGDKTHVSLLKVSEWLNMVSKSGFEILKTGGDGMWDTPYLKYLPHFLQKLIFYPPAFIQILTKSLFIPISWGEDLVVFAKKK